MKQTLQHRWLTTLLLLSLVTTMLLLPATPSQAAGPVTTELIATGDARIQGGSPDVGFGNGFIWTGTTNGHLAYVQFDLTTLPPNATITSAELRLSFTGTYTGTTNVEVGRNDSAWDEATVTWNTRPTSVFASNIQTVGDVAGEIVWPVTSLVTQWYNGSQPNYGIALKGDGPLKAFHSRETHAGTPPRLVITYTEAPDEGSRPDLGDAPDSSNSLGINPNTAYPGVAGNFPTVWATTPAGQAAGPRHANPTIEAVLGQALSREVEADSGNDADGVNNILNAGVDIANQDRADDGWRNRLAFFPHCQTTTLRIRVSKAQNATRNHMYLNTWFDGNRDGDWADRVLCTPVDEVLAIPASEWIIQDYFVDLTGIPAGGYLDIDVTTNTILNTTPGETHWLRFTLSEDRVPQTASGRSDGRGLHPGATPDQYRYGETEDVLHRPQLPGEDGTLEIDKQVITGGEPIEWIDYVTYNIRLRHVGGSQPLEVRTRDILPYPMIVYPTIDANGIEYVIVTSSTGGVAPLSADLDTIPPDGSNPPRQVVTWNGTLAPNSEVVLSFQVRVIALCEPNQQTKTITNLAEAKPRNGAFISDQVSFSAKCPGYDQNDIEFELNPIEDLLNWDDLANVPWSGEVWNSHPFTVTLGLYGIGGAIPQDETTPEQTITLAPNERRDILLDIPLNNSSGNELDQPGDTPIEIAVGFCFLFENSPDCPDAVEFPNYNGESPPIVFTPRPNDLGDAPDSTNHAAVAMLAYPGTQANYPSVFDPALGVPQGPRHLRPRPFHLGQQVSREAEADIGPDADALNNIVPAANNPNNDRFDDGVQPNQWLLTDCQTTTIPVQVFISPQAFNWFQQQGTPGYLNVWIDANRDGDWADLKQCGGGVEGGGQRALEHIVIDQTIDVVTLGVGIHTINIPTGLVPWPAAQATDPAWVRVSLSEVVANKTLQAGNIQYGDGRGYALPFRMGETEDYLLRQETAPDVAVELDGRISSDIGEAGTDQISYRLEYSNPGDGNAQNGQLVFSKPEQLRDLEIVLYQSPRIPQTRITETAESVTIPLPELAPGEHGVVILGWEAPNSQTPVGDYLASLTATAPNDSEPANDQATITLERVQALPSIAFLAGEGDLWSYADTTCRDAVELRGVSIPGGFFNLWVDGNDTDYLQDNDDTWNYSLAGLSNGHHDAWLTPNAVTLTPRSNIVRLNVDTSLPVDPLSLTFTDSSGNRYHPETLNWRRLANDVIANLQSGETYEIAIDSCIDTPNQQYAIVLPDGTPVTMSDTDGDGRYSGSFIFDQSGSINAPAVLNATATQLRLVANLAGSTQTFTFGVQAQAAGRIVDATNGQPIEGASVTALMSNNLIVPASAIGQANPQATALNGEYSFTALGSFYKLLANKPGYQAYRSWHPSGDHEVRLMPSLAGTPAHTIYITANGFEPAITTVQVGELIEWVNLDSNEHSVGVAGLDSGALLPGQSYRAKLTLGGSFALSDQASSDGNALLIVEGGLPTIHLPLVVR